MKDIMPDQSHYWRFVEQHMRDILTAYGYREIRMPLLEKTELFSRSIGDVTDIVEKEMYTFDDRDGDSVTLRPEGTASCVRAVMEHHLLRQGIQRLWYEGPMFRHERPQKGRYRQFHQIGVEVFGSESAVTDVELILLCVRLWRRLGLSLKLEINSIGSQASRLAYREQLVAYFSSHRHVLDDDSQHRLQRNPMRILDSKNPDLDGIIRDAPKITDALDDESRIHFERLQSLLQEAGIEYQINSRLVRGLDYYNRTVFEWTTDQLGSQNAVCAGGRYDGLIEMLGGPASPAMGFALGLDRILLLLEKSPDIGQQAEVYMIMVGAKAEQAGLAMAESIHDSLPHVRLVYNLGGGSFKAQMRRADRSGASLALLLGENELAGQNVGVKFLRSEQAQTAVAIEALIPYIASYLKTSTGE